MTDDLKLPRKMQGLAGPIAVSTVEDLSVASQQQRIVLPGMDESPDEVSARGHNGRPLATSRVDVECDEFLFFELRDSAASHNLFVILNELRPSPVR